MIRTLLKFFVEKATPNSDNSSLLIPDESYSVLLHDNQPNDQLKYSSVVIQIVNNGWKVYGNSQIKHTLQLIHHSKWKTTRNRQ